MVTYLSSNKTLVLPPSPNLNCYLITRIAILFNMKTIKIVMLISVLILGMISLFFVSRWNIPIWFQKKVVPVRQVQNQQIEPKVNENPIPQQTAISSDDQSVVKTGVATSTAREQGKGDEKNRNKI